MANILRYLPTGSDFERSVWTGGCSFHLFDALCHRGEVSLGPVAVFALDPKTGLIVDRAQIHTRPADDFDQQWWAFTTTHPTMAFGFCLNAVSDAPCRTSDDVVVNTIRAHHAIVPIGGYRSAYMHSWAAQERRIRCGAAPDAIARISKGWAVWLWFRRPIKLDASNRDQVLADITATNLSLAQAVRGDDQCALAHEIIPVPFHRGRIVRGRKVSVYTGVPHVKNYDPCDRLQLETHPAAFAKKLKKAFAGSGRNLKGLHPKHMRVPTAF